MSSATQITARQRPRLRQRTGLATLPDPAAVLGTQFDRRAPKSAELELVFAIVDQAVNDLVAMAQLKDLRGQRELAARKAEVREWFASDDTTWLYSFRNCCDILGIAPEYLRHGLAKRLGARGER